jgi:drug/metabolite transporter (DMT)-like permease
MATNVTSPPHRLAPALVLLLLGFVWGSSFILMKIGLFARDGSALLPPIELAALRVTIAGATLLPVTLRHARHIVRDRWRWIAGVGIIGSFIPALLFATAQVKLPSATAGMLNALSPLWTLIIGFAAFGTAVQPRHIVGIIVGLLGTVWLILAQAGTDAPGAALGADTLTPALMLVVATVCYGVSVNITREKLSGIPAPAIAGCSLGLVALPALGIVLFNGTPGLIAGHPDGMRALLAVGALAAIGTAGALVLFNQLIAWTNAVVAASVTYIIPIFAAMWGWWDGELLTYQQLLAGGSILLGVWITKKRPETTN